MPMSPAQLALADALKAGDAGDGMELVVPDQPRRIGTAPEGGLGVAILGSLYMMLVVLVLALPIGRRRRHLS